VPAQSAGSLGASVTSGVKVGPRALQETGGTLDYSRRALSDVSGGSANSFGQHHTVAMLHDIHRQLSEQAHQLSEQAHKMDCQAHKMDCQHQEIAELRRALERAEEILAKSEEEKDIWRKRSEAYRKQVSRRNSKDGSELGVQHAHPPPGCEEKVVISTDRLLAPWPFNVLLSRWRSFLC
jgi:septal ring factor EnvC (AmiA/AmiB activator)